MTARSHVAAPEGYALLCFRGGAVDATPIIAFHLVGDHVADVITPTGEELSAFDATRAMLLPDGRVHSYGQLFPNRDIWEKTCRRRNNQHNGALI